MAKQNTFKDWTYKIGDVIEFFDSEMSYEITGYRPVDETRGLDFDPTWFTEASVRKTTTGRYSPYVQGSLNYRKFWDEEMRRCKEGFTVNGYTVTGDHYFFLNYYVLLNIENVKVSGEGREESNPSFFSKQYEYFHYVRLCEHLNRDVIAFKARGVGFSEIAASLAVRPYITTPNYESVFVAYSEGLLEPTLSKCWTQLEHLNRETEGAFRRLRQNKDSFMVKEASLKTASGEVYGHRASIRGVVVDDPRKLRGRRVDRLIYEESGSNPILQDTYIKGEALVEILGTKLGTRVVFGTGGDSGAALKGLDAMFKNPETYGGLPHRHRYNPEGKVVFTGYFIGADTCVRGYKDDRTGEYISTVDHRGVTNVKMAREYYDKKRAAFLNDPVEHLTYCAEYCYYPEEALIMQGVNNFNRVLLAEQQAQIQIHKSEEIPKPKRYNLFWNRDSSDNITGVKCVEDPNGVVYLTELPELDNTGAPIKNLYVAGIDSIDHGAADSVVGEKGSKFCITVKKRALGIDKGNQYVGIYLERPNDVRRAYTVAAQLLVLFGCKANLEDTKIGFRLWLRDLEKGKNWDVKLLMTRPSHALDNGRKRNKSLWGTPGSERMIKHGLELVALYIEDYYYKMSFLIMIQQLLNFSYEDKGAYDVVLAMVYTEIGDEDMYDKVVRETVETTESFLDVGYYTDEYGNKRYGVIPKRHGTFH